jgi:hypothetical protein
MNSFKNKAAVMLPPARPPAAAAANKFRPLIRAHSGLQVSGVPRVGEVVAVVIAGDDVDAWMRRELMQI